MNVLDPEDPSFSYLWLLARRSKFYASFNSFAYQYHELKQAYDEHLTIPDEAQPGRVRLAPELRTMARTFLQSALRLAIWEPAGPGYGAPLGDVQTDFQFLQEHLPQVDQHFPLTM